MGCKMPWWAGSETPPPDKDKIISDLRAEVESLNKFHAAAMDEAANEFNTHHEEMMDVVEDLTQQLAAANGRLGKYRGAPKEWATKDMTLLIMHLKEDTNFDAGLVEEMLKFAIECASPYPTPRS